MRRIRLWLCLLAGAVVLAQEMPPMRDTMPPPADAADLEKAVAANPEDVKARQELIGIYIKRMAMPMLSTQAEGRKAYLPHARWLIEHHPEAALPALPGMAMLRPEEADGLLEIWKGVLARRGADADLLFIAGSYYGSRDARQAIALLKKSRQLGAARAAQALGTMYFGVLLAASKPEEGAKMRLAADPALAGDVQAELEKSADVDVYGTAGGWLVCFAQPAPKAEFVALGQRLVARALAAEPANVRWASAAKCVERAKARK